MTIVTKRFLPIIILTFLVSLFCLQPALADEYNVKIEYKGKMITRYNCQKPFIDEFSNRIYVPTDFVVDYLGAKVEWNEKVETLTICKLGSQDKTKMRIGFQTVKKNDVVMAILLDAPLRRIPETKQVVVPLRFIAENLGYYIQWDDVDRIVRISDKPFAASK